jgi:hypothetical protein
LHWQPVLISGIRSSRVPRRDTMNLATIWAIYGAHQPAHSPIPLSAQLGFSRRCRQSFQVSATSWPGVQPAALIGVVAAAQTAVAMAFWRYIPQSACGGRIDAATTPVNADW